MQPNFIFLYDRLVFENRKTDCLAKGSGFVIIALVRLYSIG